jgi:hypothetical protein
MLLRLRSTVILACGRAFLFRETWANHEALATQALSATGAQAIGGCFLREVVLGIGTFSAEGFSSMAVGMDMA